MILLTTLFRRIAADSAWLVLFAVAQISSAACCSGRGRRGLSLRRRCPRQGRSRPAAARGRADLRDQRRALPRLGDEGDQ